MTSSFHSVITIRDYFLHLNISTCKDSSGRQNLRCDPIHSRNQGRVYKLCFQKRISVEPKKPFVCAQFIMYDLYNNLQTNKYKRYDTSTK